jgi:hypothetical protein
MLYTTYSGMDVKSPPFLITFLPKIMPKAPPGGRVNLGAGQFLLAKISLPLSPVYY